jgi:hypothetical protein
VRVIERVSEQGYDDARIPGRGTAALPDIGTLSPTRLKSFRPHQIEELPA